MAVKKAFISRAFNITAILVLFLIMMAGFTVYAAPHTGWRIDDLRSGSMSPLLKTGDLVVTRPVQAGEVSVGDIIVVRSVQGPDYLLCHRVTGIEKSPSIVFKTKGDANTSADPFTVPAGNLVGEMAFSIPGAGYLVRFLQTRAGLVFSLVIPGLAIIAICLRSLKTELKASAKKRISDRGPGE
jgi:signal peptidase I